jgi:hypothetical protein
VAIPRGHALLSLVAQPITPFVNTELYSTWRIGLRLRNKLCHGSFFVPTEIERDQFCAFLLAATTTK